ncbi:Rieske 2Fe-2S domain-containing protein [Terrilactibacillus sp. BCM23-1]|uniref:Rieske 2Fe-2S domain-containing protein n=1 Tax=Terrilactibacillus tamarindi TaxID=2599694 RepID=A0A6N8CRP8_9BACI|nr:aromatic ring-hydroxylating dioxygenase subunit alpha [Terrilactibacillus tamarindi]MTT32919.1 Rieske 2Fe-2S domain-containing protein [Terrilactibacillus tamarindi]
MKEQTITLKNKQNVDYPKECTFSKEDWEVLSKYWFPVAESREVTDKPMPIKLLDVNLVVYRTKHKVVVFRDLCVHRGTPLSMGWVEGDDIVCPYHGFRYGTDGKCTSIPAHPDAKISPRLCMSVFPVIERFGLVWTSLLGKEDNLPHFEAWEDDNFQQIVCPPFDIKGSAGRQMEGFLDVAHFAWVHTESFGDRNNAFVPRYQVDHTDYGLHVEYLSTVSNYPKGQQSRAPEDFKWLRVFDVYPPFGATLKVHFPNDGELWIMNAVCPISARETRLFVPIARNFDKDSPIEDVYAFNLQVFTEDSEMVENQKPEELPLDLQMEAHIMADRTSVAYRKLLKKMGLGAIYTS